MRRGTGARPGRKRVPRRKRDPSRKHVPRRKRALLTLSPSGPSRGSGTSFRGGRDRSGANLYWFTHETPGVSLSLWRHGGSSWGRERMCVFEWVSGSELPCRSIDLQ